MPPLKVVLPEPHFVDPDVLGFVNKYPSYQLPQPRMSTESNVFVSHYGLVSKYGWLNRHCMPNLFPPNDISQFWSFQKKVAFQEAVCRFGSSLKVKNLGPAHSYLLIHHKWFGYFFWMTCYMPRLLICIVGPPPRNWSTNFVVATKRRAHFIYPAWFVWHLAQQSIFYISKYNNRFPTLAPPIAVESPQGLGGRDGQRA